MNFSEVRTVILRSSRIDERRARYTIYVTWIILPVALVFPLLNSYTGLLATVLSGIVGIILVANLLVYHTNWVTGQRFLPVLGGFIAITAVLYFLYLGYGDGASAMWMFVLPLLSVFMLGLTWGLISSVFSLLASSVIMSAGTDIGGYQYTTEFTLRFCVAFAMVSALASSFEYWRVSLEIQKETVDEELSRTRNALAEMANVCSWCNSIRSSDGNWISIEHYVANKEAKPVSHSICPSCSEKETAVLEKR